MLIVKKSGWSGKRANMLTKKFKFECLSVVRWVNIWKGLSSKKPHDGYLFLFLTKIFNSLVLFVYSKIPTSNWINLYKRLRRIQEKQHNKINLNSRNKLILHAYHVVSYNWMTTTLLGFRLKVTSVRYCLLQTSSKHNLKKNYNSTHGKYISACRTCTGER